MKSLLIGVCENVILRQFVPSNAPAIFELIDKNREHLEDEGISQKYPTEKSVLDSITVPANSQKIRFGIWNLVTAGTSKKEVLVGSINMTPHENRWAEVGYWIGKDYQGNGYVKRSVERLIRFMFKNGDIDVIAASVRKENKDKERSIGILKKAGLQKLNENEEKLFFCLERWPEFYLDAMTFYGTIPNRTRWEEVVKKVFRGDVERLKKMKSNNVAPIGIPDFGEGVKYKGFPILGEWFEKNKINPAI